MVSYPNSTSANRIINGFEVPPHSLPFQVLVVLNFASGQQKYCGGTLISPSYVLTAASCFANTPVSVFIFTGDHDITVPGDGGQIVDVLDFLIHPLWNPPTTLNDYAILKLTNPVDISTSSPNFGLACLSLDANQNLTGVRLTTSGWGKNVSSADTSISNVLRATFLRGISLANCGAAFGAPAGFLPDYLLCAVSEGNTTICTGDDGGKI